MRVIACLALALAGIAGGVRAQVPWPVRGLFRVPLDGHADAISSFAARPAGLYFRVGNAVLHTGLDGSVLNWVSFAGEAVSGMAVDGQGSLFVLSGNQTLLSCDAQGVQTQATPLDAPARALTMARGQPWGLGADDRLRPLLSRGDASPRFVIEGAGAAFELFPLHEQELALLDGSSVRILDVGTGSLSSRSLAAWTRGHPGMRLESIAGASKTAFVLGVPPGSETVYVLQLNATGYPRRELQIALPAQAQPHMMGLAGDRLFLADRLGTVWYADAPSTEVPVEQRLDSEPVLLSDVRLLQDAVRKNGVAGRRLELTVNVDETGRVTNAEIRRPIGATVPEDELIQIVSRWRFEPAVKSGKQVPAVYRLSLGS